jgi:acylphosphatase
MEFQGTDQNWRIVALVRGRVQGVGFRYYVRTAALRLQVKGWVRNEPDGSVRVVAQGPPAKLRHLINALYTGPSLASVKAVDLDWSEEMEDLRDFSIRA